MAAYTPPLRDIGFVLDHVVDLAGIAALPGFEHADADTVRGLLEEYGRFVADVIAPLDRVGDVEGCRFDPATGSVTTPTGFPQAYRRYVEAGWGSVPFEEDHGGGGFPWVVAIAMQELLTAANMAFSLCPLLTQGAIHGLLHHGNEAQRETYLRPMVSGRWTGTMALTEPDAGSDVGALRTRAVQAPDGTWRLTGTKIFITYGDHDLSENIVHLVLARLPDAPPGTRGISMFVVPKFLVNDDGTLGERNDVRCLSIEHKMGIHASPTCVLSFGEGEGVAGEVEGGGAVAELVGEANAGMRHMFTMMNNARLSVGLEGLAVAERAYQKALAHALARRQGRPPGAPAGVSALIIDHADVRRMLLTMRAHIEAMRALLYLNAAAVDRAGRHPGVVERRSAQELVELLTPVSKAWCTDLGTEVTSLAVQVHGGMGYIEETGVAQHYRDVRIAAIYEGTNGIQAIDLVSRKLTMDGGRVVRDLLAAMAATAAATGAPPPTGDPGGLGAKGDELAPVGLALGDAVGALTEATEWVLAHGAVEQADALAAATPYLRMLGLVTGGWLMARQAAAAVRLLADDDGDGDADFLRAKVVTARFYAEQLLPQARGLLGAVTAGHEVLYALEPRQLA